jgi:hypothetical protein
MPRRSTFHSRQGPSRGPGTQPHVTVELLEPRQLLSNFSPTRHMHVSVTSPTAIDAVLPRAEMAEREPHVVVQIARRDRIVGKWIHGQISPYAPRCERTAAGVETCIGFPQRANRSSLRFTLPQPLRSALDPALVDAVMLSGRVRGR